MGFFDRFRSKPTNDAEAHIRQAGELTELALSKSDQKGKITVTSWEMGQIDDIMEDIQKAVELEPSNPEYRYLFACALQARLHGEQAEAELKRIVENHPQYAQAEGHLLHRERWFLPFLYPSWSEKHQIVTESIIPYNMQGCFITPVRTGIRRIVSFFAWFPRDRLEPLLRPNQRATIRAVFMNTPYCPVVGAYALIDTNPTEPFTLETILRVDSYRSEWSDCSRSGYWLIRMLAQQNYTYFVIADPGTGKAYFNRLIQFDKKTCSMITSVAEQVRDIKQTETDDESLFISARQHFTNNFSLDNITF